MTPFSDDREEIAWAIGIIEGEGWIGSHNRAQIPRIEVSMTDHDVIERLRNFLGGTINSVKPRKPHHKPAWRWVHSRKTFTYLLLAEIQEHMSERRAQRITEVLDRYDSRRKPDALH